MESMMSPSGAPRSEAQVQAEHDAYILAMAEEIMKDKRRLQMAKDAVYKMTEDAQDKAIAMKSLADKVRKQVEK